MKKIIVFLLPAFVIMACNNAKQNENKTGDKKETVAEASASGKDTELINWLNGKMLTSEDPAKDYHNFKLHSDGTCEDKGGAKISWTVKNGKLDIGGLMKIGIDKKDETTIILHRALSDETYKVGPIQ